MAKAVKLINFGYDCLIKNCNMTLQFFGLESHISEHSEAEFSHGICPDCDGKLYPELFLDYGDGLQVQCHFGSRRL